MKRAQVPVLVLLVVLLGTACTAVGAPSVDRIVERLQESQTVRFNGVMETTTERPDGTTQTTVVEQWQAAPMRLRIEYLEGPEEEAGGVIVSDGETMWHYDLLPPMRPVSTGTSCQTAPDFFDRNDSAK